MRSIIQFRVSKGEKKYTAECMDLPIVTESDSLDQLSQKIQEALTLHMEGEELSGEFTPCVRTCLSCASFPEKTSWLFSSPYVYTE